MKVNVIQDDRVTAVQLVVTEADGTPLSAVGTATRHPDDSPDPTIGQSLALARAFKAMSQRLTRYGYDLVKLREMGKLL